MSGEAGLCQNRPPIAIATATPNPAEATGPAGATVMLDGTGSSDPDGDWLTYMWTEGMTTLGTGSTLAVPLGFGTHTIALTVADGHHHTVSTDVSILVHDTMPPLLSGEPTDITVEAVGPGGTIVSWTAPTAVDLVDGSLPVSCDAVSGSVFPVGATLVRCSATDSHGNTTFCLFTVTVRDTVPPVVRITSPSPDALLTGSTTDVVVQTSDLVGVASLTVNGVAATRTSGSAQTGVWRATVPIALPIAPGGALTFDAVGADSSGNAGTARVVVDNDGIPTSLDRGRASGADQSTVYSSDFSNTVTSGTVFRNNWTTVLTNQGTLGTVRAQISGLGTSPARFSVCGGTTKEVRLRAAGDVVDLTCATPTGTLTARAVSARPWIEVSKQQSATTWLTTLVPSGSTFTTGSPSTASADNTAPVDVQVMHVGPTGALSVVGGFRLLPGESVDVSVTPGAAGNGDTVRFNVLRGRIVVSLSGQTRQLAAGEETTMAIDRTPARQILEHVLATLAKLRSSTRSTDRDRIEDATKSLSEAVEAVRWLDDDHVRDGDRVFDRIGRAVTSLDALTNEKNSPVDRSEVLSLLGRLVAASQLIATVSVGDAASHGTDAKVITGARAKLVDGDARRERDRNAIDRYRDAWKKIERR